jgi:hypothetical protein
MWTESHTIGIQPSLAGPFSIRKSLHPVIPTAQVLTALTAIIDLPSYHLTRIEFAPYLTIWNPFPTQFPVRAVSGPFQSVNHPLIEDS